MYYQGSSCERLNAADYKYSSATSKGGTFIGDSYETLDKSIVDFVKLKSSVKIPNSQPIPGESRQHTVHIK